MKTWMIVALVVVVLVVIALVVRSKTQLFGIGGYTPGPGPAKTYKVGDRIGGECLCSPASARIWASECCRQGMQ